MISTVSLLAPPGSTILESLWLLSSEALTLWEVLPAHFPTWPCYQRWLDQRSWSSHQKSTTSDVSQRGAVSEIAEFNEENPPDQPGKRLSKELRTQSAFTEEFLPISPLFLLPAPSSSGILVGTGISRHGICEVAQGTYFISTVLLDLMSPPGAGWKDSPKMHPGEDWDPSHKAWARLSCADAGLLPRHAPVVLPSFNLTKLPFLFFGLLHAKASVYLLT